jgi:hypothetical protein
MRRPEYHFHLAARIDVKSAYPCVLFYKLLLLVVLLLADQCPITTVVLLYL